jgi:hypothetical protein
MHRVLVLGLMIACPVPGLVRQQRQTATKAATGNSLRSDDVNGGLTKWLRTGTEYRARAEGFTGGAFKPNNEALSPQPSPDQYLSDPDTLAQVGFQRQDAHLFLNNQNPAAPPYQDSMDLSQAYIEIGDLDKGAVSERAGRQELAFGDDRLLGNANWLNTARSFDALRGTIRHSGFRSDLFAACVVKLQDGEFDWSTPGNT